MSLKQLSSLLTFILIVTCSFGQNYKFDYQEDFNRILNLTQTSSKEVFYDKLLKKFLANDASLTNDKSLALLIGFTQNQHYKPYEYRTIEREIANLNRDGKCQEALTLCNSFLTKVPLSQQVIYEKSYALKKLNKLDEAKIYMMKFLKIMQTMENSGDGLTPETSFFSLGPNDGQNFILKYKNGEIISMNTTRDQYGNLIEMIEMRPKNQKKSNTKTIKYYFQIDHASKTLLTDPEYGSIMEFEEIGMYSMNQPPPRIKKKVNIFFMVDLFVSLVTGI